MIKLAPSILSSDFSKLGEQIKIIENAGAHYVHIDVMDGNFVPNISLGQPVIKSIRNLTNMTFDVHLMIDKPERYIEDFAKAGADIINIHVEACEDIETTIRKIKSLNKRAAVTVKPKTKIDLVYPYLEELDLVLIMSVEPGFGGQTIIKETLDKAHTLADYISNKKLFTEIEMDGGIYLDNLNDVLNSGVNVVVAGTAIFGADDINGAVREFYNEFAKYEEKQ